MDVFEVQVSTDASGNVMTAMRIWLEQHRVRLVMFHCRNSPDGVVLGIRFHNRMEAEKFAHEFNGAVAIVAATTMVEENSTRPVLNPG
jgi:hypothetical protein